MHEHKRARGTGVFQWVEIDMCAQSRAHSAACMLLLENTIKVYESFLGSLHVLSKVIIDSLYIVCMHVYSLVRAADAFKTPAIYLSVMPAFLCL